LSEFIQLPLLRATRLDLGLATGAEERTGLLDLRLPYVLIGYRAFAYGWPTESDPNAAATMNCLFIRLRVQRTNGS
jgi:hypothetical protein